jgi:hypothetical protein
LPCSLAGSSSEVIASVDPNLFDSSHSSHNPVHLLDFHGYHEFILDLTNDHGVDLNSVP